MTILYGNRLFVLFVLLALAAFNASATERLFRVYDQNSGLPVSNIHSMAQDTEGFFWLSTAGGLYRFDGREFHPWAKDKINSSFNLVYAGPNGEVLVGNKVLYRVLPNEDAEVLTGIDGQPFTDVRDVAFTGDGRLWVAGANSLFYRDWQGAWHQLPFESQNRASIKDLSVGLDGTLLVVTSNRMLEIGNDNIVRTLFERSLPDNGFMSNVIAHPDGSLYFMEKYPKYGKILRFRDGQITEIVTLKANLQGFVLRGQTVWVVSDTKLVAFRPGETPEILQSGIDIPAAGFSLVDKEGSLWSCTIKGLIQYPEPETVIWTERDGLPSTAFIRLIKTDEGLWVTAWGYISFLFEKTEKGWQTIFDPKNPWWLCVDGRGTIWGHRDYAGFFRRDGKRFTRILSTASDSMGSQWSLANDGTVWIPSAKGLWRTSADNSPPRFWGNPLGPESELNSVFEDSRGILLISSGEKICRISVAAVRPGQAPAEISCQTLADSRTIEKPVEMADGSFWAGSETGGAWRYTGTRWEQLPGYRKFPSMNAKVETALSGGAWVYGDSMPVRAVNRPDLAEGWQIVESVLTWQGVPQVSISTMLEDSDGSLWLGTVGGLVRMPAAVRYPQMNPPRVKLVDFVMNGEHFNLNSSLQIPSGHNQLEIHFAALTYRDRSLLKLQYRLHNSDDWTDLPGTEPNLWFFNLGAGQYSVEMRASLDGESWSPEMAQIKFEVLPYWYLRSWAIALFVLLTTLGLYLIYRVRIGMLLKLEKQRARIARDLHDEIGSGLGSIGILSSVVSASNIGTEQRRELTNRIVETADELGTSLADIVWSLRSDVTTLETLAYNLTRRAESLFANDKTQFTTKFPDDWNNVNLTLAARHNVLLIAMESLHNAAKHARAANVTLQFAPTGGRGQWLMQIEDDGCGLPNSRGDKNGSGLGLQSMRRRAAEIGAEINWTTNNGCGTIVCLKFNPNAKELN